MPGLASFARELQRFRRIPRPRQQESGRCRPADNATAAPIRRRTQDSMQLQALLLATSILSRRVRLVFARRRRRRRPRSSQGKPTAPTPTARPRRARQGQGPRGRPRSQAREEDRRHRRVRRRGRPEAVAMKVTGGNKAAKAWKVTSRRPCSSTTRRGSTARSASSPSSSPATACNVQGYACKADVASRLAARPQGDEQGAEGAKAATTRRRPRHRDDKRRLDESSARP